MRIGIFELEAGATDERAHRFATAIDAIDYPWRRIIPALRDDPDQAVVVRWDALRQGTTGLYYGGSRIEIHLSEADSSYVVGQEPFVIAHEIGHLVDGTTLDRDDRAEIIDLLHASPETYRRDGEELNGEIIEWAHVHDHVERWHAGHGAPTYYHRINEAYADLFVATFAPTLWEGHYPRFTHWTSELDEVRRLTLRREILAFTDVPADHPHRDSIERAAELGLVAGYPDGTYRPGEPLTRAQAATIAVRQHDRLLEELTR